LTASAFSWIFALASARLPSRSTRSASFCAASAASSAADTSSATCAAGCRWMVAANRAASWSSGSGVLSTASTIRAVLPGGICADSSASGDRH
jgi:hypothetical protein